MLLSLGLSPLVLAGLSLAAPGGTSDQPSSAEARALHAAYSAALRAAVPTDAGGFVVESPTQAYRALIDADGMTVDPHGGTYAWGLELVGYGVRGSERSVDRPGDLRADGTRVERRWDARLCEWYENHERGLEHGFTLEQRPAGTGDALGFTLAVRGGLEPRPSANGRDVAFVDADGAVRLRYDGLVVFDRDGDRFPARFEAAGDRLVLTVEDAGADYPLTIDPVVQQAYLKASTSDPEDFFGHSVAYDGDRAVIGAWGESSDATGVNGDETPNDAGSSGAAYVFVNNAGTWTQEAYLKASNTGQLDEFGRSVDISGDTIVVGAPFEDGNGVSQGSNAVTDSGAAYVFVRNAGVWSQQAYLKASNPTNFDRFGWVVRVDGDTIAVGAPLEDSAATGIGGDQGDVTRSFDAGAVYVFTRNGGAWSQQAYLKASNTGQGDLFGYSVGLSGDTITAGAPGEDSDATGVDGDGSNNNTASSGALYVFTRAGGVWSQEAYLKASNTGQDDRFGGCHGLDGDLLVVAAPFEDSGSAGVGGDQFNNSRPDSGAAYVFVRNGGVWSQQAYLKASNPGDGDSFGQCVAVDEGSETVIIGAHLEESNATGFDGDQGDNSLVQAGAAYAFRRNGGAWSQVSYIKASNTGIGDQFGFSAAVQGPVVLIGAPIEASDADGVNGDETDDSAGGAGAVYAIDLPLPEEPPVFICNGGSVLIYPIHRSALGETGVFNVVNVTNTNRGGMGTTDVHFQYVNVGPPPSPFLFASCSISNRVETLTPADTLSVLTSCHNGALGSEGYLVVSAMDPDQVDVYWSFNHLIGSEQVISAEGGMYSLRPWDFCSPLPEKAPTDLDMDGRRDFDGLEYEPIPDELYLDSFIGEFPGQLILLSLTGGEYLTMVDFIVYNDDEFQLSAQHAFACWTRVPLGQISGYFTAAGLSTTSTDPRELDLNCDMVEDVNTGWAIVRPKRALSITSDNIDDPAVLGAITNDDGIYMGARLLWESVEKQTNGQFPN